MTDRRQIGIDVLYTLIHRLGVFRLALFFTDPLWDSVFGQLHVWGFAPFQLDQYWPGVTDRAWVSLIIYLLLFDAVDYFYHRAQHRFGWLWSLHAVHHSQRQMTIWSDDRNHLLDDMLRDVVVVFVSQLVGVPPAQFVAVVAITSWRRASRTPICACISAPSANACWSARAFTGITIPSPTTPRRRPGRRLQLRRAVPDLGRAVPHRALRHELRSHRYP